MFSLESDRLQSFWRFLRNQLKHVPIYRPHVSDYIIGHPKRRENNVGKRHCSSSLLRFNNLFCCVHFPALGSRSSRVRILSISAYRSFSFTSLWGCTWWKQPKEILRWWAMKKQCSVGDDVVFEINLKSWRSSGIRYLGYQTKQDCLTNLIPMIFSNLAKLFLSFFLQWNPFLWKYFVFRIIF